MTLFDTFGDNQATMATVRETLSRVRVAAIISRQAKDRRSGSVLLICGTALDACAFWPSRFRSRRLAVPLLTCASWRLFCHSFWFSTPPSCFDSNDCSKRQLFETRDEPQGRQSTAPSLSPLSESMSARSPTALGLSIFSLRHREIKPNTWPELLAADYPPCGGKTTAPKKSQIFPVPALPFSQTDV
jgi:hypothetical protein